MPQRVPRARDGEPSLPPGPNGAAAASVVPAAPPSGAVAGAPAAGAVPGAPAGSAFPAGQVTGAPGGGDPVREALGQAGEDPEVSAADPVPEVLGEAEAVPEVLTDADAETPAEDTR